MTERARRITREEQREQGLLRPTPSNYLPASTQPPAPPPATTAHIVQMDIEHPARQEVIVSTSAVDRAKGYQIVITPLAIALGVLAVLVSLAFENEFFSFASLLIFWISFVLAWLAGWIVTALASPEFVSWYGAKRQWDIIEREQQERWEHYKWQTGRLTDDSDQHPRTKNRR